MLVVSLLDSQRSTEETDGTYIITYIAYLNCLPVTAKPLTEWWEDTKVIERVRNGVHIIYELF